MTALTQARARIALTPAKKKGPLSLFLSKLAGLLSAPARKDDEPNIKPFPFFGE